MKNKYIPPNSSFPEHIHPDTSIEMLTNELNIFAQNARNCPQQMR